ncbi:MAG: endosialidase [Lachnospiraceae bacterium]|nr:endosialidase [Lachnospiraceae bacterium]
MSVVKELLRGETNGSISFGDYTLEKKTKREDFEFGGDLYKVKTFREITKLEKNGAFVYESVPGTAVHQFAAREDGLSFRVESYRDCEITVELAESTQYLITYDGEQHGLMETNRSGKLSIGVEMEEGQSVEVRITKR